MTAFNRSTSTKEEFDQHLYELQMEVLNEHRQLLCKTIRPSDHFPYLRQEKVLSLEGQELIESKVTTSAKVLKLLEELESNGGPKAYRAFTESLTKNGTQSFLLTKLNQALEEKVHKTSVDDAINKPNPPISRRQPTQEDDMVINGDSSLDTRPSEADHLTLPSFESLRSLCSQGGALPAHSDHGPYGLIAHSTTDQ